MIALLVASFGAREPTYKQRRITLKNLRIQSRNEAIPNLRALGELALRCRQSNPAHFKTVCSVTKKTRFRITLGMCRFQKNASDKSRDMTVRCAFPYHGIDVCNTVANSSKERCGKEALTMGNKNTQKK